MRERRTAVFGTVADLRAELLRTAVAGDIDLSASVRKEIAPRQSPANRTRFRMKMPAYQRIFHADGSCDELRIGTMTLAPRGGRADQRRGPRPGV